MGKDLPFPWNSLALDVQVDFNSFRTNILPWLSIAHFISFHRKFILAIGA
jgi:hypothetical protein